MSKPKCFYKCVRADGTDFYTGTVNYAKLAIGQQLVHPQPDKATGQVCGAGFHVCDTPKKTIQFADRDYRPWRWFAVDVDAEHIIAFDDQKFRVSALTRREELTLADIFGADFAQRIEAVKAEAATWKNIPWLKPPKKVSTRTITKLFHEWHAAISPWIKNYKLPNKLKIVTTVAAAAAADAADADAAAAAAADADAAAAAADAAAADAAAAAAVAAAAWRYWRWTRWYVRPYYNLYRCERWKLADMEQPNPWSPLVAMCKLGCRPIGYVKGEFIVYVPPPAKKK